VASRGRLEEAAGAAAVEVGAVGGGDLVPPGYPGWRGNFTSMDGMFVREVLMRKEASAASLRRGTLRWPSKPVTTRLCKPASVEKVAADLPVLLQSS